MFNTEIFNNGSGSGSDNDLAIPQPIDITYQRQQLIFNNSRFRRESIAHSQGMGGVLWGSVTIGLWLKDEVMMLNQHQNQHQNQNQNQNQFQNQAAQLINPRRGLFRHPSTSHHMATSPPLQASYLPNLEADYCKDYSCCGQHLPTLHDLLRHYEEAHISLSPPADHNLLNSARSNRANLNNIHNVMETVSTNDVFLNTQQHPQVQPTINAAPFQFNLQHQTINQSFGIPQQRNNSNTHQNHNGGIQQHGNGATSIPPSSIQQQQLPQQVHPQQVHHQSPLGQSRPGSAQAEDDDSTMYIDDPARHLYVMENTEHKPFKCPVIGCEKTYKNQNGLKYHRLHGHQNQKLKENPDGTISIIDPESNTPYLDGAGMEKDKPYRCEVCGKRYKNLNGLKYHRGHTTH